MKQFVYLLLAAAAMLGTSLALGRLVLALSKTEKPVSENGWLSFVLGSSVLSGAVWLLASIGLARKGVFLSLATVCVGWMLWNRARSRLPDQWSMILTAAAVLLYAPAALAPPNDSEATARHLPRIQRVIQPQPDHARILPDGFEAPGVFAVAIGQQSAAGAAALFYTLACGLGIFTYCLQSAGPRAAILAAALFLISPAVHAQGTTASPYVPLAALALAGLYVLRLWRQTKNRLLLIPLCILWGHAAWIAAPLTGRLDWQADAAALLNRIVLGDGTPAILGPVFLLAPISFLRLDRGQLFAIVPAALLSLLAFSSGGAGSLIPAIAFWSIAIANVAADWAFAGPVLLLFHLLSAAPPNLPLYSNVPRGPGFVESLRAALRIEAEDAFLQRRLPGYHLARRLEAAGPPSEAIWDLVPFPAAYHTHRTVSLDAPEWGSRLRQAAPASGPAALQDLLRGAGVRWIVAQSGAISGTPWLAALLAEGRAQVIANEDGYTCVEVATAQTPPPAQSPAAAEAGAPAAN